MNEFLRSSESSANCGGENGRGSVKMVAKKVKIDVSDAPRHTTELILNM